MWWFGPPAILKGWLDRCLAHGALHSSRARFDAGPCRGKRALLCVTTGASAAEAGPHGKEGHTDLLLWPVAYALRYCGFTILAPALVHGVHDFHEGPARDALRTRLASALAGQPALIAGLGHRPRWPFHPDDAFDADGRLRPGEPALWPFTSPPRTQGESES